MQSKTVQEFKTVYSADIGYLRKMLASGVLYERIVCAISTHFSGLMLTVDTRIEVEDAASFTMSNQPITKVLSAIGQFNVYGILHVRMRLSESSLDRWLRVTPPIEKPVRIHREVLFGCHWSNGYQNDVACRNAIGSTTPAEEGDWGGHVTHIYIPSTDSREIPIYPCEPYTPKKADPKSWSQMLSVDLEAEVQSQHGKVDFKPFGGGMLTISKAVAERITNGVEAIIKAGRIGNPKDFIEGVNGQTFNFGGFRDGGIVPQADKSAETFVVVTPPFVVRNSRVEESIERLWAKIGMKLPMTMRSDMLTVGRWLKEEGFTCQEWVDYIRSVKRPDSLGEPVREKAQREWESFPNPTAETIRVVSTDPARKHPLDELVEPWDAAAERNAKRKPVTITLPTDPIEDSAMQFAADGKVYHSTTEQLATLVTEAMKKPELREAVFKKLASDLDRETLIAIWAEMDKE